MSIDRYQNPNSKTGIEERKKFFKMLLSGMTLEEKLDELYDLPIDVLNVLLKQFEADEEYEICLAFKRALEVKDLIMNTKLSNIVKYQHQKFEELIDPVGQETLRQAYSKLKPLEDEIVKHSEADIDLMASGNVFITGLPDNLLHKVSKMLGT